MTVRSHWPVWTAVLTTLVAIFASGTWGASAADALEGPGWALTGRTYPTNLAPGAQGSVVVDVFNIGAAGSKGKVTITDVLPPGVTATKAGELIRLRTGNEPETGDELWVCAGNGLAPAPRVAGATVVTCTNNPENMPSIAGGGGHPDRRDTPNHEPELVVGVRVAPSAGEVVAANRVTIAGGGALTPASTEDELTISAISPSFGFSGWDSWFSNPDGTFDTQAGSHPYEATFSFDFNTVVEEINAEEGEPISAGGEARNLEVKLPPGLVGDPYAVPRCPEQDLLAETCPDASQVGTITIPLSFSQGNGITFRVYNMVPSGGVPAELGFNFEGIKTFLDVGVRSGSDYGLTSYSNNIPQKTVLGSILTIWGVPADKSHDTWRAHGKGSLGGGCTPGEIERSEDECFSSGHHPSLKPFLTLPTACAGPQVFSIHGNTWQEPIAEAEASFLSHDANGTPTGFSGCERLGFGPTTTASPDTGNADTPAGLTVEVKPPVGGLTDPEGLGTSDIENTTVTLPEGLVINPGQAAGLQACPETEASLKENDEAPMCPGASKVGSDEIETPLLAKPLQGNVYILQSNPPNLQLLVAASGEGVNLKLVGHVHLDGTSGRLVTTFSGTPELPFTNFRLSFSGGAQAALATPTQCGTYTATSDFTPWSSPLVADAFPSSSFQIVSGTNNAPCPPSPLPFGPSLIAGSTTDQAGGYTDFSLLLKAPDDQQRIERLQFKVPQGLLGMISQVPLCVEPQASNGTCSSASQIGHTTVASGPGPYPLVVPQPGQPPAAIYLTGPYKGAPYGLSIVVPVVVGPFTLETQIVRAKIEVDSLTAQITVTTDPFPQVIDGVPTDLRTIDAVIDRPGFMFNPTNCSPLSFSGTAYSAQGASTPISSPFQMGSCRSLLFKPNFKVSTSGKTSRKNGASLDAKIVYPRGQLGANQASSQSNLKSVKVDLPKQLPSRLTTLQKACTSQVFEANPANCPADSRVGTASAITPVLPVELTGPAYFVSYGGAKFPELVFILQGFGVTIQVHGETFINKEGVTSSTFHQVPDVPIYQFELKLPEGPFSALAANGNLCKTKLKMPTSFTAQDGAVIHQTTPIGVTGCAKTKTKKAKKPTKHAKKGKQRK